MKIKILERFKRGSEKSHAANRTKYVFNKANQVFAQMEVNNIEKMLQEPAASGKPWRESCPADNRKIKEYSITGTLILDEVVIQTETKNFYECSMCGQTHDDPSDAARCYDSHGKDGINGR